MLIKFNDLLLAKISKKRPFIYWIAEDKNKQQLKYYFVFQGQNDNKHIELTKSKFYEIIKEVKKSKPQLFEIKFGKQMIGFNFHDEIEFKIFKKSNDKGYMLEYYDLYNNDFPMGIDDFYNQAMLQKKIKNFD